MERSFTEKPAFDFSADYVLENESVMLRPLKESDIRHLLPFSMQADIWKYSSVPAIGEENFRNYIMMALEGRTASHSYPFIVYDKVSKRYAGSTRFYDIQLQHNSLQLGYTWYGQEFQQTGLNRNCKLLLLEFAFEKMGINRVEFRADNDNAASIAAMKKIGCKVDGILRENMLRLDGTRRSSIVLSILKEEWNTEVKELIKSLIR